MNTKNKYQGNESDVEKYRENGFLVLKNFIPLDLVKQMKEEWEEFNSSPLGTKLTVEEPVAVFWCHVPGQTKRVRPLKEFRGLNSLALSKKMAELVKRFSGEKQIRLLETIIFSKPPQIGNQLNWHQDVSYFPFNPNNQIAVWTPFEEVVRESGALQYVPKSHKWGIRGSVNLHTGTPYDGENRPLIPQDPEKEGYEVYCAEIGPGDLLIHDGLTWHKSGPNLTTDQQRRGLSLRYLIGETRFAPRPGNAATFISQLKINAGDLVTGPAFPLL